MPIFTKGFLPVNLSRNWKTSSLEEIFSSRITIIVLSSRGTKERLAESEERVRKELGLKNEESATANNGYEARIRGKFRQQLDGAKERKNAKIRLSIVIAIIFFVGYMLYNNYVG